MVSVYRIIARFFGFVNTPEGLFLANTNLIGTGVMGDIADDKRL